MLLLILNISFDNLRNAYNWISGPRWDSRYKNSLVTSTALNIGPLVCIHVSFMFSVKGYWNCFFFFLQLWIFSLISDHNYRCVAHINLKKAQEKFCNKVWKSGKEIGNTVLLECCLWYIPVVIGYCLCAFYTMRIYYKL